MPAVALAFEAFARQSTESGTKSTNE